MYYNNAMLDTRRHIRPFFDYGFTFSVRSGIVKFLLSLLFALGVAYLPTYTALSSAGVSTLFILLFAAALWVTEAIPAFSVALLIIALEIVPQADRGSPGLTSPTGARRGKRT